jgi:hypothetical protein
MASYLRLHVCVVAFAAFWASACSTASPKMSVLGVKAPRIQRFDAPSMKVFVEVHNPTRADLSLKRLRYRLVAKNWFDSRGVVKVDRVIAAGASAIVEILVPVQEGARADAMQGVPYTLDARLFAVSDKTERSWQLKSSGSLASSRRASLAKRHSLRVATGR